MSPQLERGCRGKCGFYSKMGSVLLCTDVFPYTDEVQHLSVYTPVRASVSAWLKVFASACTETLFSSRLLHPHLHEGDVVVKKADSEGFKPHLLGNGTIDRGKDGAERQKWQGEARKREYAVIGKGNKRKPPVLDPCNLEICKCKSCIFAWQVHSKSQLDLTVYLLIWTVVLLSGRPGFRPLLEGASFSSLLKQEPQTHSAVLSLIILSDFLWRHSPSRINTALHCHYELTIAHYSTEKETVLE